MARDYHGCAPIETVGGTGGVPGGTVTPIGVAGTPPVSLTLTKPTQGEVPKVQYDCTGFLSARLVIDNGVDGPFSVSFYDGSTWRALGEDGATPTADPEGAVDALIVGPTVPLAAACTGDLAFRVNGLGTFRNAYLQFIGVGLAAPAPTVCTCALAPGGFYGETFDFADTAALEAAASAASDGDLLYGFGQASATAGRRAEIDPAETFCGHASLRHDYTGGVATGGAEFDSYFAPWADPWTGAKTADAWARLSFTFPVGFFGTFTNPLRLAYLSHDGDAGTWAGLYALGGRLELRTYGTDAGGSVVTTDVGDASALATGAPVDVVMNLTTSGGSFTVRAWWSAYDVSGTTAQTRTLLATATRGTNGTGVNFLGTGTANLAPTVDTEYHTSRVEVHFGETTPSPYCVDGLPGGEGPAAGNLFPDPTLANVDVVPAPVLAAQTAAGGTGDTTFIASVIQFDTGATPPTEAAGSTVLRLVPGTTAQWVLAQWDVQDAANGYDYVTSVYVKVASGVLQIDVSGSSYNTDQFVANHARYITPTSWAGDGLWHRVALVWDFRNFAGQTANKPRIQLRASGAGTVPTGNADIQLAGMQFEAGVLPTTWSAD